VPLDVVWFKLPLPPAWRQPRFRFEFGGGHLMISLQAPDGLLQVAWVILKGSYGDLRQRGIEEWALEMAAHADPELSEHITAHRHEISRPFLLDVVTDRVIGWASPGALLIGDAAHTMSPVGAQGLNLALRDAIVTANQLVPACRMGADLNRSASRVEALRGPEIDRVQRFAALPPRLIMGRSIFHTALRHALARLLGSPAIRNRAASSAIVSTFLRGSEAVRLEI
jgi:2-polyprenyl-6-methoxyphenol hydroxylase-like FAD-dependent oxidoreductase